MLLDVVSCCLRNSKESKVLGSTCALAQNVTNIFLDHECWPQLHFNFTHNFLKMSFFEDLGGGHKKVSKFQAKLHSGQSRVGGQLGVWIGGVWNGHLPEFEIISLAILPKFRLRNLKIRTCKNACPSAQPFHTSTRTHPKLGLRCRLLLSAKCR